MKVNLKRPARYVFVYIATLTWDFIMWLGMIIMWAFWGTKLRWVRGVWFEFKKNSWPTRTWYARKKNGKNIEVDPDYQHILGKNVTWGGTSFGHSGFFGPGRSGGEGIDTGVEFHEHEVHGEQAEVASVYTFLVNASFVFLQLMQGVDIYWWFHLALWTFAWPMSYGCSMLVAWLRGEGFYRGNIYEESAYSQTREFGEE